MEPHKDPAFRAAMPSTANAMEMSQSSLPALLGVILILSVPYGLGVILHAFGLAKWVSLDGLGQFISACAFLLIVLMAVRGTVLHAILSFLALSGELQRVQADDYVRALRAQKNEAQGGPITEEALKAKLAPLTSQEA